MLRLASFALIMAACGGADVTEPEPQPEPERNARFVGRWAVEQPYHAGYEITFYTFEATGVLIEGESRIAGADIERTGTVARGEIECFFGSRWHTLDASTLVIAGVCSDNQRREIVLAVNDDATGNTSDAGVQVISVGGEPGWAHPGFEWRFRRCGEDPCSNF